MTSDSKRFCPKENYGLHVLDSGTGWKCSKCLCMSGIVGFMHCPIVQGGSFFSMHVRGNSTLRPEQAAASRRPEARSAVRGSCEPGINESGFLSKKNH